MKIPLEVHSTDIFETSVPETKELIDDPEQLANLPEEEFYNYVNNNIHKIIENQKDRTRVINALNKIDALLEKKVKEYSEIVNSEESNSSEVMNRIEALHTSLTSLLNSLFKILVTKINISKFRSMEHLITLIPICMDFSIIRKCLHVLFSKLGDDEIGSDDYTYIEPLLPRFSQNIYQLYQHYNLASFYSRNILEFFQDDEKYPQYAEKNKKQGETSTNPIKYSNDLVFEIYKENPKEKDNPEVINLQIERLHEKYAKLTHIQIARKINAEHNLNLQEGTTLWDSLTFKIRACLSAENLTYRAHVISVAIDSLKIIVCLRRLFTHHDTLKKYLVHLPPPFDFTGFVINTFELFYLKVIPDLHESVVTCLSSILTLLDAETDDYRDFSNQIMNQYFFIHKLFKDCLSLNLEFNGPTPTIVANPVLLPPETARNIDFLGCILYLIHIGINHFFIDAESNLPTNQIYSITGIISSLLSVLKPPVNGYFVFNIEAINIALDTIWMILPNQNFINDLNIMDRLIDRVAVDLNILLDKERTYYHYVDGVWKSIKPSEHFEAIQGLLKLLDSPFEHQLTSRVQMAPTMARKITESPLIGLFRRVIEAEAISDSIFMQILLLVSDIARELPYYVEKFIEDGIMDAILTKLSKPIPKDFPHVHLIVYFINMLAVNKKGFELERNYKILEKLFDLLIDRKQVTNPSFIEFVTDIGKELSELIKSLEIYRELVADAFIDLMGKIIKIEDDFLASLTRILKGEQKCLDGILEISAEKKEEKIEEEGVKGEFAVEEHEFKKIEATVGIILSIVQNCTQIFSKVFSSEHKMREIMHGKEIFKYLFKMLSFPLFSLAESTAGYWYSNSFKHIANRIAGTDQDIQKQIYDLIQSELDGVEELVGKLNQTKDFSTVLSDDICYDARMNGLYHIVITYREKSLPTVNLMGRLTFAEMLIEFLKYHEILKITQEELFNLMDRLSDLYAVIVNQIKREDATFILRSVEKMKEEGTTPEKLTELADRCSTTIMSSHASNRFTFHHTLRKFFKKMTTMENDADSIQQFTSVINKIIRQLAVSEISMNNLDEALDQLVKNHTVLTYLLDYLQNTNYKRIRTHPQIFFDLYQEGGFDLLLTSLNNYCQFFESNHHALLDEIPLTNPSNITLSLVREGLSFTILKLSHVLKSALFVPIQTQHEAKINGKIEPSAESKLEYYFGAQAEIVQKFIPIFKAQAKSLEVFYLYHLKKKKNGKKDEKPEEKKSKSGSDELISNLGHMIDILLESVKRIQEIGKETTRESGLFGSHMNERMLANSVIETLVNMGFSRESAELATRNIPDISVESAVNWLLTYEQTQQEEQKKEEMIEEKQESVEAKPEVKKKLLEKLSKDDFQKNVVNKTLETISKHIISNIFLYEGYEAYVFEIIHKSLDAQEPEQKKMLSQEIAIIAYKLLKHNINNFAKGTKFLSQFKVSKSFEKSIELTKLSLARIQSQKSTLLSKLRSIYNVLPWFSHFLTSIPNLEKNLLRNDFHIALLRFFEHYLKELEESKETGENQELVFEISNRFTEKFFQIILNVVKLRENLEGTKKDKKESKDKDATKDTKPLEKTPSRPPAAEVKEQMEKEITTIKKEGDKERETASNAKKHIIEILINILSQADAVSLKQKKSIVFTRNSLCVYMKIINVLIANNRENAAFFLEKKGLQELLKYKLDNREPKGQDFLKEFSDLCLHLMSEQMLDTVSLECDIKAYFFHNPEKRVKLRTFTEHFREAYQKDPETFMSLMKKLCVVEDKDKEATREKTKRRSEKSDKTEEEKKEGEKAPEGSKEEVKEGPTEEKEKEKEKPKEKLRRNNTMEKKPVMMVSLKHDIEYSHLYTLGVFNTKKSTKKRRKSRAEENFSTDEEPSHYVLDYLPPSNCMNVIHSLIETLVTQFNEEISDEKKKDPENKEVEFHPIFTYSLILATIQIVVNKYPILIQSIMRMNVSKYNKKSLKNPVALANIGTSQSFLSYFLRVIVFSTMELFRKFLAGICSLTNLIVDKDRSGNAYSTPYFYELKEKILRKIYQILDEEITNKCFYRTKESLRMMCSISSIFSYLLPLKDICKIVFDNHTQYNFLKLYSEAVKQIKVGDYALLEKVSPFIMEPYALLVQYHHYLSINRENEQELTTTPNDLWMPKKALIAENSFGERWRELFNPAGREEEIAGHSTRVLRLPEGSESDISEDDEEGEYDNMFSMSGSGEELESEAAAELGLDGSDHIDEEEHEGELMGIEEEDEDEEESHLDEEDEEEEDEEGDEWTDLDDDEMDEEDDEEDESESLEGDDHIEVELFGEGEGHDEDNPDEEHEGDEDDEGEDIIIEGDDLDEDDISEEFYDEDDDGHDEDVDDMGAINIFIDADNRRAHIFARPDQAHVGNISSLLNIPQLNHPEIQRINNLLQTNSVRFDQPSRDQEGEATTVFDRIHDRVLYLQSPQYLDDHSHPNDFHVSFFENSARNRQSPFDDGNGDGGIRFLRTLRGLFEFDRPLFDVFSGEGMRRQRRMGLMSLDAPIGDAHRDVDVALNRNQPESPTRILNEFENQLVDQLAQTPSREIHREMRRTTSSDLLSHSQLQPLENSQDSSNPFEDLRLNLSNSAHRRNQRDRMAQEEPSSAENSRPIESERVIKKIKSPERQPEKPAEKEPEKQPEESKGIDFAAFGLEPDWLEKNGIDPDFFNELSDDLKLELMLQYKPADAPIGKIPQSPQKTQEPKKKSDEPISEDFLNALPDDLRKDIFPETTPSTQNNNNAQPQNQTQSQGQTGNNGRRGLTLNDLSSAISNILGAGNQQQSQQPQQPASEARPDNQPTTTQSQENTGNQLMNNALDNAAFIASLTPDLREEVLLTADPAFLASLPPEMAAEAEALRERRAAPRFESFFMRTGSRGLIVDDGEEEEDEDEEEEGHIGSLNPFSFRRRAYVIDSRQKKKSKNYLKEAIQKDKAITSKLYSPDDKTIEHLLALLYMNDESFGKFPFSLLKALCLNPQTECKVLDYLLYLLKNPEVSAKEDGFPCRYLYEKNSIEKNYKIVYEKASLKALFLLENLTENENLPYFVTGHSLEESQDPEKKKKERRKSIQNALVMKGQHKDTSFMELIKLTGNDIIQKSAVHLKILFNVLYNIVRHSKSAIRSKETEEKPEEAHDLETHKFRLDNSLIKRLCQCLCNEKIDDDMTEKLSTTICLLCLDKQNFNNFIKELGELITTYSHEANEMIFQKLSIMKELFTTSPGKMKEEQIPAEKEKKQLNLLNRLDAETDYDIRLHKILQTIEELYEKALIEAAKKNKKENEETKEISTSKQAEAIDSESREKVKNSFRNLFENNELNALWINITEFLSTLNDIFSNNWALLSPISHKLQPVLESFFIIYKILNDDESYEFHRKGKFIKVRDAKKQAPSVGISKIVSETDEEVQNKILAKSFSLIRESKLDSEDMLLLVCEKNKSMLNMMIKQNPSLLSDSLSVIIKKMPQILDFENKRAFFKSEIKKLKKGYHHPLKIRVTRANIFTESYNQIAPRKPQELRGKLVVEFIDEEGLDAGGVAREWFLSLSREMLNPNYALFKPAAHGSTSQPNPRSDINPDHLKFFKFVGRIIGKALHDGYMLDCYFTRSFYKHMLGQPLTYHDIEDIDPEYYRNLKWILENDITGLDLTFSYEADEFGEIVIRDLIPDGRNIPVTEENKRDYVQKICYAKMANDIKDQIEAFLEGFHELIPPQLIQIFDNRELELMISGLPDIDLQDLKENTEYHNYTKESEVIVWLWEVLEEFDRTQKAAFLQFVTGTSKVPLGGFKELVGMGGAVQKFQIHRAFDTAKLPTSHTCFNQLDLPEYKSKEILREKLLLAITEGREGFGFV